MPAETRISGPRFGYRPEMLGAALTTAATRQATSESALTRSTSWWSMTAMSPGRSRLVRFLVRRSSRTVPVTPGADSWARPRRRVPMRMTFMLSRGPRATVVRRATATYQLRTVHDTGPATTRPASGFGGTVTDLCLAWRL